MERAARINSYEQWTRSEIARLRSEAQKATAEADTLQRTLDKWLESQGRRDESHETAKSEENHSLNGQSAPRRTRRAGYGNKNTTALEKIKASPNGLSIDELFSTFSELYGPKYKRSSLRALLWYQKEQGNIENKDGRYIAARKAAA